MHENPFKFTKDKIARSIAPVDKLIFPQYLFALLKDPVMTWHLRHLPEDMIPERQLGMVSNLVDEIAKLKINN